MCCLSCWKSWWASSHSCLIWFWKNWQLLSFAYFRYASIASHFETNAAIRLYVKLSTGKPFWALSCAPICSDWVACWFLCSIIRASSRAGRSTGPDPQETCQYGSELPALPHQRTGGGVGAEQAEQRADDREQRRRGEHRVEPAAAQHADHQRQHDR